MMFKKVKSLLSLLICISVLCTVMPITSYAADAAENVASVTFNGNTEYYTTIDDAWNAAVALDTTAENKATIKLLADCTSNSMLNLVYDYFILDTNNKTLTGTSKLEYSNYVYSVIYVDGGSLEIIGNGTITGYTKSDYTKGILIVNNGVAYIDGVTVHNTGTGGAYGVVVRNGGDFYLLDGHIISDGEYALSAGTWDVYLYSGKIESSGRRAMTVRSRFHICYSDKPIYLINNDVKNKDMIIYSSEPIDYIMLLDDHVGVDLEYSQNPDGSNPISLKNVKKLSYTINHNTSYLKFQTFRQNTITVNATEGGTASSSSTDVRIGESVTLTATADEGYIFDGWYDGDTKVCDTAEFAVENVTEDKTYTAKFTEKIQKTSKLFSTDMFFKLNTVLAEDIEFSTPIKIISFVDLNDYDLEGITTSDYSADLDGSVLAWYDEATFTLYIGGYGKIIAGRSLAHAFAGSTDLNRITGLDMLDTSNVTDMEEMFSACGRDSKEFTLDLGDNFDTSNVTNMKMMFYDCGSLTLDLGNKFDTSKVTNMYGMFSGCGSSSFTLNLGDKFDTSNVTNMGYMFSHCGGSSKAFTLNLGDKFDTSNVTHMEGMFNYCGRNSRAFALDLGDKFDTSNVTDMRGMFNYCGEYCPSFSIDFGDKFDTSNVTDMSEMFSNGSKSLTTLDLSTFNVGENTKLDQFAYNTSVNTFIFGEGWKNATLPSTGRTSGAFYNYSQTDTTVIGATENLCEYDWASDNRIVNGLKPQTYTVTANAETGGTVSGGSEVTEGESVTLTATANDGYTFAGWYDGDTKVCDTAEFVVTNVTANKTYTAKFTKNQIVEPDPEPEEPEIPYLKWDGSTLTLVKKASAKCRVGIVYVGGATFDTNNINWDELVAAGKDYANLNSPVGYAIYGNFTKRTPGTRGNYVAFVKYTKEDGTTTADYITFNVKNAVSFERPSLSYNPKTRTLKMKGNVSSTIGVAYIGESEVDASNVTWNDFVKVGKLYPDENGSSGYTKVLNTLDYTKTFNTNGNYVAFIKYFDGNLNKSLAKYYTFTVDDYNLQPTDIPFALAEESQIILNTNGFDVAKVTIVYIGTDDVSITNWNEFSAAAAKFSDINGKELNQQYTNPKDGSVWKQKTAGWYGVYIRYNIDGERCNSYCTVEVK